MRAIIEDGYTRHVGIGDNITVPEIEFRYRPPRGAAVHEIPLRLAVAKDKTQEELNKILLEYMEWWDFEGCDSHVPDAEVLTLLDAHAYKAIVDVVINGYAPKRFFDRPDEDDDDPKGDAKQAETDAGNSPAG